MVARMPTLSSTLRVQLIDAVSGPAKGAASGLKGLEGAMARLGKSGSGAARGLVSTLEQLRSKSKAIGDFRDLRRGLKDTSAEFKAAKSNVDRLKAALAAASSPTKRMQADLRSAQSALKSATSAFKEQGAAVRGAEAALRQFGITGRTGIARSQQEIRNEIAKTIRSMRNLDRESRAAAQRAERRGARREAIGGVAGVAGAAAGHRATQAAVDSVKKGAHREAAINKIRNVSNSEEEVRRATQIASEVSGKFPYTSQEGALHDYVEMRSIAATNDPKNPINYDMMRQNMGVVAQTRAALASSGEDLTERDVRSLMLALEGSGRANDPAAVKNMFDAYTRAKQVFGTAIDADKVRDFVANAKSSNFSMSDPAFFNSTMARLAQGNASRLGNEFSQTLSTIVGGRMTLQGANWLADKGLIRKEQIKKGGGGKFYIEGNVKNQDLLSTDQTAWAQQVLMPGLEKSGVLNKDVIHKRMDVIRKASPGVDEHQIEERAIHGLIADSLAKSGFRSTVTDNLAHAIANQIITDKNVEQMKQAKGLEASNTLGQNPVAAMQEMVNAVGNFASVLTSPAMQTAGSALHSIAGGLSSLSASVQQWQKDNPGMAKALGAGAPAGMLLGGGAAAWWSALRLKDWLFGGSKSSGAPSSGAGAGAARGLLRGIGRGGLGGALYLGGEYGISALFDKLSERLTPEQQARYRAERDLSTFDRLKRLFGHKVGAEALPGTSTADPGVPQWRARMAEIDARVKQIDASTHPSMQGMSHPEKTALGIERAGLERKITGAAPEANAGGAASAAQETGAAYNEALKVQLAQTQAIVDAAVAQMMGKLSFIASPTIKPKLDMSAIGAVHADTGIDP